MEEIWKDIEGYEGLYQVSNLGRVKSLERIIIYSDGRKYTYKNHILKPKKVGKGYLCVDLYKNSERKMYKVHRLVGQAFIDNPNNLPEINHIDENKENNNVNNLEWCSRSHNINHGTRNKRMAQSNSIPIYCLETNSFYKSLSECAKELSLSVSNIGSVLKGRLKQTKGYTFRYANKILFTGGK